MTRFMVRDDRLVAVPRDVAAPATLRSVLTALLEGPTNDEAKSGLRTAIPGRTLLLSAAPDASVGRVNVSDSLLDFEGQEHFTTGPVAAFAVEDIEAARTEMRANYIEFLGPTGGEPGGYRWAHFRGPDGNVYELTQRAT